MSVLETSVYVDRWMAAAYRCSQVISLPYAADTSSDVLAYVSNASFNKKLSYRRSNIANLAEIFHLSKDDRVFGVCLN